MISQAITSHEIQLKRAKNARASIHQLPVEIFTSILQESSDLGEDPAFPDSNLLYRLAQVSTTWRHVIKATPPLWRWLSSDDSKYTHSLVRRINPRGPLSILHLKIGPQVDSCAKAALAGASQWEYVFLRGEHRGALEAWSRRLSTACTPFLTELYVYIWSPDGVEDTSDSDTDDEEDEDEGAPDIVLGEGRNLLAVELMGASLSWDSNRLTGLRVLSLRTLDRNIPTISQLYTILSSSPLLECLILSYLSVDDEYEDDVLEDVDVIRLDRLSKLQLWRIPSRMTTSLLSNMEPSSSMRVDVNRVAVSSEFGLPPRLLTTLLAASTANEINVRYDTIQDSLDIFTELFKYEEFDWIHDMPEDARGFHIEFHPVGELGWDTLASCLADLSLPPLKFEIRLGLSNAVGAFPIRILGSLDSLVSLDVGNSYDLREIFEYLGENEVCPHLTEVKLDPWYNNRLQLFLDALIALVRGRQGEVGRLAVLKDVWAPRAVTQALQLAVGGARTVYHRVR